MGLQYSATCNQCGFDFTVSENGRLTFYRGLADCTDERAYAESLDTVIVVPDPLGLASSEEFEEELEP